MSSERSINEKTVIALPIPAFWALVVMLIIGTSISTAAFVSIKRDIAQLGKDTLTCGQFRDWLDELRAVNEETHLRVPPLRTTSDGEPSASTSPVVLARKEP